MDVTTLEPATETNDCEKFLENLDLPKTHRMLRLVRQRDPICPFCTPPTTDIAIHCRQPSCFSKPTQHRRYTNIISLSDAGEYDGNRLLSSPFSFAKVWMLLGPIWCGEPFVNTIRPFQTDNIMHPHLHKPGKRI